MSHKPLPFEATRLPGKDGKPPRDVARFACHGCTAVEEVELTSPLRVVRKYPASTLRRAEQKGWTIEGSSATCSACTARLRQEAEAENEAANVDNETAIPHADNSPFALFAMFLREIQESRGLDDLNLSEMARVEASSLRDYKELSASPESHTICRLQEALQVPLEEMCLPDSIARRVAEIPKDDWRRIRGLDTRAANIRRLMDERNLSSSDMVDLVRKYIYSNPAKVPSKRSTDFSSATLRRIITGHRVEALNYERIIDALGVSRTELDRPILPAHTETDPSAETPSHDAPTHSATTGPAQETATSVPGDTSKEFPLMTTPTNRPANSPKTGKYRYVSMEGRPDGRLFFEIDTEVGPDTVNRILELLEESGTKIRHLAV